MERRRGVYWSDGQYCPNGQTRLVVGLPSRTPPTQAISGIMATFAKELAGSLLRPGRDHAGHARVGDELAHVLVGVNDDAEIHAVYGGIPIGDVDFAREVFVRHPRVRFLPSV